MKKLLIFSITAYLVSCTEMPAVRASGNLAEQSYRSEGAGVILIAASLFGAAPQVTPIMAWFEPGDRLSPFIFDLFPCKGLFCKTQYAGTARVHLSRLKLPDGNSDPNSEAHLKQRVIALLRTAEQDRQKAEKDYRRKFPHLATESLRILRAGNGLWARVAQLDDSEMQTGSVYWRILGGEYTLSVSYGLDRSMLPSSISYEDFDKSFEKFVSQLKITGAPKSRN